MIKSRYHITSWTTSTKNPGKLYTLRLDNQTEEDRHLSDNIDKRQKLQDAPFDFQITKDQRVLIYWHGKQIKIVAGKAAQKLIAVIDGLDDDEIQLALAKATGNFKRGNERLSKSR